MRILGLKAASALSITVNKVGLKSDSWGERQLLSIWQNPPSYLGFYVTATGNFRLLTILHGGLDPRRNEFLEGKLQRNGTGIMFL